MHLLGGLPRDLGVCGGSGVERPPRDRLRGLPRDLDAGSGVTQAFSERRDLGVCGISAAPNERLRFIPSYKRERNLLHASEEFVTLTERSVVSFGVFSSLLLSRLGCLPFLFGVFSLESVLSDTVEQLSNDLHLVARLLIGVSGAGLLRPPKLRVVLDSLVFSKLRFFERVVSFLLSERV